MEVTVTHLKITTEKVALIDEKELESEDSWKNYNLSLAIFETLKSSFEEFLHIQAFVTTEEQLDTLLPIKLSIENKVDIWRMETNLAQKFPDWELDEITEKMKPFMRLIPATIVDFAKRTYPEKFEEEVASS